MRIVLAIAFFSQWSGNGLVSYYMNLVMESIGITNTRTQSTIGGCLQIFNLATALVGTFLIDKVGRRRLFIISTAGMLLSFSVWSLTIALVHADDKNTKSPAARATIPFIFMYYLFYNLAYSPMLVAYTLEILPYAIRAKGFACMNMGISAALAFNQFVSPLALDALGWKYYLVYCGWLVFELIFVILYVVETRGRTLEETAALFDGEDKPNRLAQLAREAIVVFTPGVSGVSSDEHDDEVIYPGRGLETESYELKRPKLIMEKDRQGYTKGSEKELSYTDSV
ncbi:hypothetical protein BC826DRAFT_626812 [Russula brevipes]|nr:hypothetical protein BC826DRAFT_626812 [Russula brevipes]